MRWCFSAEPRKDSGRAPEDWSTAGYGVSICRIRMRPRARMAGVPESVRARSRSMTTGRRPASCRVRSCRPCIANVLTIELSSMRYLCKSTAARRHSEAVSRMRGIITARCHRRSDWCVSADKPKSCALNGCKRFGLSRAAFSSASAARMRTHGSWSHRHFVKLAACFESSLIRSATSSAMPMDRRSPPVSIARIVL